MEEHTDSVDCIIESAQNDLLMKVEEQIITQVAKTESDDASGDEGDPVMVTCGKLIISASDKDERYEKQDEILIDENYLPIENEANKHFTLTSIEKVDEEDFEAVFEFNSDIDEIGLSESDIKALELMESKEYIVLTDKAERPTPDDFSSSVLKFQDAIENYTKSVFSGISDTMIGLEKVKNVKSQPTSEEFSETLYEVQETYAGRVPVIEEPFEEIKVYLCGESEVKETFGGQSPTVEEPFEAVSLCEESDIFEEIDARIVDPDPEVGEKKDKSQNIMVISDENANEKNTIESKLNHTNEYMLDNTITNLMVSGNQRVENGNNAIEHTDLNELHNSNSTLEDANMIKSNVEISVTSADEEIENISFDETTNIKLLGDANGIEQPINIEISATDAVINNKSVDETNNIKLLVLDTSLQTNEDANVIEEPSNIAISVINEDVAIANISFDETTYTTPIEDLKVNDQSSDILLSGTSEGTKIAKKPYIKKKDMNKINEDTEIKSSKKTESIDENISNNKFEISEYISTQEEEEADINKYADFPNKGLQRNAESRKSKKNIKIQKPLSQEEEAKIADNRIKKMEDMQLLLNTILVIAFGIFLFLIGEDTSSYPQDNDQESHTRIPASVSSVIEGYVQLSSLAEMELRK